jgi:prepilin peptidase CpaA
MIIVFGIFVGLMALAMLSDIRSMTIPNRLNLALVTVFALSALWAGMPGAAMAFHVLFALAVLSATAGLFAMGWMGGGDAKLIAATALWFGPSLLFLDYMLLAALLGGGVTLALLAARAMLRPTTGFVFLDRLLVPANGIPYGVALGGAAILVALSGDWTAILS